MSTKYKQERNHPNWTGRVPRQSRITGEWSRGRRALMRNDDRIPPSGYLVGLVLLALLFLVNFI